jgi:ribosomal protein S18 acetylase RimI-like enzyme
VGARRVGEPLFGTASRVDLWLVLEVHGPWADEVGDSLDPHTAMGRALLPVLKAVPRSRLLFIKGAPRAGRTSLAFYVAISDEFAPRLYHFELDDYHALEELDLFGVLADDAHYDAYREARPLYLVCTHGTHDRCCAKFGFPFYSKLVQGQPECVWQSSHVGGDRFAANLVCLPSGIYYGQVEPDDAEAIVAHTDAGRVLPARWRGRSCYVPPVQAAEYYLRDLQHETDLSAYRLWSHRRQDGVTTATFLTADATRLHTLRVAPEGREGLRFLTCGTCEKKPVTALRLVDHQEAAFEPETHRAGELSYQLRPAAMRDYRFIYCLRRSTLQCYLDEIALPPAEQGPFYARFDYTRHCLVYLEETPVGALSVLERDDGLHLANLHLLPAYQGRGLGTALVRGVQARAVASRQRLTTQVLKVNPARAFYERLGFQIDGDLGLRHRMVWKF